MDRNWSTLLAPASLPAPRRIPAPDVTPRTFARVAPLPFRRRPAAVVRSSVAAAAVAAAARRRPAAAARLAICIVVAAVATPRLAPVMVAVVVAAPVVAPRLLSVRQASSTFSVCLGNHGRQLSIPGRVAASPYQPFGPAPLATRLEVKWLAYQVVDAPTWQHARLYLQEDRPFGRHHEEARGGSRRHRGTTFFTTPELDKRQSVGDGSTAPRKTRGERHDWR
jgi:hypothetical protein